MMPLATIGVDSTDPGARRLIDPGRPQPRDVAVEICVSGEKRCEL